MFLTTMSVMAAERAKVLLLSKPYVEIKGRSCSPLPAGTVQTADPPSSRPALSDQYWTAATSRYPSGSL